MVEKKFTGCVIIKILFRWDHGRREAGLDFPFGERSIRRLALLILASSQLQEQTGNSKRTHRSSVGSGLLLYDLRDIPNSVSATTA